MSFYCIIFLKKNHKKEEEIKINVILMGFYYDEDELGRPVSGYDFIFCSDGSISCEISVSRFKSPFLVFRNSLNFIIKAKSN